MTERDIPDNWSQDQTGEPIGLNPNYISDHQTTDLTGVASHSQSVQKRTGKDDKGLVINSDSNFNLSYNLLNQKHTKHCFRGRF